MKNIKPTVFPHSFVVAKYAFGVGALAWGWAEAMWGARRSFTQMPREAGCGRGRGRQHPAPQGYRTFGNNGVWGTAVVERDVMGRCVGCGRGEETVQG